MKKARIWSVALCLFLAAPARGDLCDEVTGPCLLRSDCGVWLMTELDRTALQDAGPSVQALAPYFETGRVYLVLVRPIPRLRPMAVTWNVALVLADGAKIWASDWILSKGDGISRTYPPFALGESMTDLSPRGHSYQVCLVFPRGKWQARDVRGIVSE